MDTDRLQLTSLNANLAILTSNDIAYLNAQLCIAHKKCTQHVCISSNRVRHWSAQQLNAQKN